MFCAPVTTGRRTLYEIRACLFEKESYTQSLLYYFIVENRITCKAVIEQYQRLYKAQCIRRSIQLRKLPAK